MQHGSSRFRPSGTSGRPLEERSMPQTSPIGVPLANGSSNAEDGQTGLPKCPLPTHATLPSTMHALNPAGLSPEWKALDPRFGVSLHASSRHLGRWEAIAARHGASWKTPHTREAA